MTRGNSFSKTAAVFGSPLQLIVMLYDGALKYAAEGKEAMLARDYYKQNDCLKRAQRVVGELISCLDMERGGEIARNLLALYTFIYNSLVMANLEDRVDLLDHCARMLGDLRESWAKVEADTRPWPAAKRVRSPRSYGYTSPRCQRRSRRPRRSGPR